MDALKIFSVIIAGVFKFFISGIYAYHVGFSFVQTVLFTGIGGCVGTIVFYLGGARVLEYFRLRYVKRMANDKASGKKPKRIFTRTNRLIVRVKRGYGLQGLAAIAPPILSIPITAVLAAKYFRHDRRTLPFLLSSVVIWTFVLSFAWSFFR